MGREVSFDLEGGEKVDAPSRHGLLYDAEGEYWGKCSLLVAGFDRSREEPDEDELKSSGLDYFRRDAAIKVGAVDLPPWNLLAWKKVGGVEVIYYRRVGKHEGRFRHSFGKPRGLAKIVFWFKGDKTKYKPAPLYRLGDFYRVELPKGCVVDDRGIVFP